MSQEELTESYVVHAKSFSKHLTKKRKGFTHGSLPTVRIFNLALFPCATPINPLISHACKCLPMQCGTQDVVMPTALGMPPGRSCYGKEGQVRKREVRGWAVTMSKVSSVSVARSILCHLEIQGALELKF